MTSKELDLQTYLHVFISFRCLSKVSNHPSLPRTGGWGWTGGVVEQRISSATTSKVQEDLRWLVTLFLKDLKLSMCQSDLLSFHMHSPSAFPLASPS